MGTSYQQRGEVSVEGRPALRLLRMNEHKPINSYKKKAIARAIQEASGELIVTTDADCWMGPEWLGAVVSAYRSEEHTSELQSLMRISYAVFCLNKKKKEEKVHTNKHTIHEE